jgi:hypothetical protein
MVSEDQYEAQRKLYLRQTSDQVQNEKSNSFSYMKLNPSNPQSHKSNSISDWSRTQSSATRAYNLAQNDKFSLNGPPD